MKNANTVNVKFEVFDNHPGVGHKCGVVHEEVMKFKVYEGNFAIIPDAGKHYIKLMKQFNGPKMHLGSRHLRYEVNYHIV